MDIVQIKNAIDIMKELLSEHQYEKLEDMVNIAVGTYHDTQAIEIQTKDLEFLNIKPKTWAVEDVFEPDEDDSPFGN